VPKQVLRVGLRGPALGKFREKLARPDLTKLIFVVVSVSSFRELTWGRKTKFEISANSCVFYHVLLSSGVSTELKVTYPGLGE
jgi:hypothetical protein